MKSESVCTSVLDLLFLLGSGSQTATISEPEYVNVSDQRPLCRSSQLLICVGLAVVRQYIYKQKIEQSN